MDIPTLSMNMAQANVLRQLNISMIKMAMEQTETQGAQLVQLMQAAAPVTDSKIDIKV